MNHNARSSNKPIDIRSIFNRFGKIDFLAVPKPRPVPAKMPFTNHLCMIACAFKKVSYRFPILWNEVITGPNQNSTGES